jgi:Flp pilus assembly protein TadD
MAARRGAILKGEFVQGLLDFDVAIEPFADGYRARVVASPAGEAHADFALPLEAEAALREAIRLNPGLSSAHLNLGNVLDDTKRRREAEAAYREAIRLDPGLAVAHNNLGRVLKVSKRKPEADAAFREAARLDPAYRR